MEASLLLAMLVPLACCTPEADGAQDVQIAFEGSATSSSRGLFRSEMRIGLKRTANDAFRGDVKEYWMNRARQFPAKIWFQWKVAHKVTKIGFTGISDHKGWAMPPKEFSVIGSMDCATSWTTLLNVRNADFKTSRSGQTREFKTWNIPSDKQGYYSCVGLSIASTMGRRDFVVALTNIVMWEPQFNLDSSEGCDKLIANNFYKPCSEEEEPVCATDKKIYQNTCPFNIAKCKAKDRGEELEQEKCANHLLDSQRKLVETAFNKFPKNDNGGITVGALQNGLLRNLKKKMPFPELMGSFQKADVDRSGEIVLSEFVEAIAKKLMRQSEENAKFWFGLIDKNGDKVIDANELRSFLTFIGADDTVPNEHEITYDVWVKGFAGNYRPAEDVSSKNYRQAEES